MPQEAVQAHGVGETDSAFYPNQVNYRPLTPISFLEWAATVHPDHVALVDGQAQYDYAELYERSCRLAGALHALGVEEGQVVGVMSPNTAMMVEAHYAIPMLGAVIATINPRRDVETLAYLLGHSEANVVLVDYSCLGRLNEAIALLARPPAVIVAGMPKAKKGKNTKIRDYETFVMSGSANFRAVGPHDEWQSIGLNYTQGTESAPKGVLYHHRGAYLDTLANVVSGGMGRDTVYLWTLPMFRAHGWCHVWSVAAVAGTQICLPSLDVVDDIIALIKHHKVTHMGGKRGLLAWLAERVKGKKLSQPVVLEVVDDGYNPADIEILKKAGFKITLLYGMTETYGPAAICQFSENKQEGLRAHTSAHYPTLDRLELMHPDTMKPVPLDGKSVGEIMIRGNTVFKGYYKDPAATKRAFRGGMFHTGDMGVIHPDGHVEITTRRGQDSKHGFSLPAWLEKLEAEASERAIRAVVLEIPGNLRQDDVRYALFVDAGDSDIKTKKSFQKWLDERLKESERDMLALHMVNEIPLTEDGDVMRYRLLDHLR
ncbi:AMP-binding protein [bacterium]|nr:AMP-binding protein [bacterium]